MKIVDLIRLTLIAEIEKLRQNNRNRQSEIEYKKRGRGTRETYELVTKKYMQTANINIDIFF